MALYFLSYDLRNNRDYQKLYDELKSFGAIQVLESTWCFKRVNTSIAALRDYFKGFIDKDDGLLIDESVGWATYNSNNTPNNLP
ncbi:hypothetical protein [Flagellimonas flava]|uniref:CRISPR associated protein Cas2 n=1 Tax=Flagellimonas flava TaxID=570519 RepID=A0A1M5NKM6_9FLAO|nr:hypothetical protein [Allomuricauda flava]SHG89739.1 hypothetical protein SAMN04488116_2837 [Allomuricauda flava]